MKPYELYNHLHRISYDVSGFDVDYKVEVNDDEKKVYLFFKYSDSNEDWIVNLLGFLPIFRFPLFYTMGWKVVFDNVKGLIFEELIRKINEHKDYTVEISGHSYGGAMSVVAGIELYKQTGIKPDITTFGSPKSLFFIYSKFLAKRFLGKVEQYAHKSDCVIYCPPLIGYHNVNVIRLGKFSIKGLFNPNVYHQIYGDESIYEGVAK